MASLPVSGPALRFGHRLRVRLGGSFQPLADLLGLKPRTLAHVETWSGPTATAMLLLAESPAVRVPELAERLLREHGRTGPNVAAMLATEVEGAGPRTTFGDLLDKPIDWVYWATSERASKDETLHLAHADGIVCRPLLESGGEIHGYLYAIRPHDRVLLAYDDEPCSWLEVVAVAAKGGPPEALSSREHPTLMGAEAFDFSTLLPPVFRFIRLASPLGERLATGAHPYRLFDDQPAGRKQSGWFSALAVREMQRKLPRADDFEARGRGQRSRMTRYQHRDLSAAP